MTFPNYWLYIELFVVMKKTALQLLYGEITAEKLRIASQPSVSKRTQKICLEHKLYDQSNSM